MQFREHEQKITAAIFSSHPICPPLHIFTHTSSNSKKTLESSNTKRTQHNTKKTLSPLLFASFPTSTTDLPNLLVITPPQKKHAKTPICPISRPPPTHRRKIFPPGFPRQIAINDLRRTEVTHGIRRLVPAGQRWVAFRC